MPLFMVERDFAEAIDVDGDIAELLDYNEANELKWLFSFLSPDKRKSYCLYEAKSAEAVRKQAEALGLPADVVIEVTEASAAVLAGASSVTGHPAK